MKYFLSVLVILAMLAGCASIGGGFVQLGFLIQCGPFPMGPSDCNDPTPQQEGFHGGADDAR